MEYGFADFLKLLGSLGLFLYGMKLMSEALQKVAGDKMRNILSAMTSNRVKGVFTGILITALIQSSSATTVMVVSFVNAGLLSLVESIGVIMGANIGTTVTAWLISILGFKVSMAKLALPIIGFSLPFLFSSKRSKKSWGELIMGFALLFIGLQFLKESMPDIKNNPEILNFLGHYTDLGYLSYFIFLAIGTVLTILIQSSSATMALTLIMCANGLISFEMAAAMVLGENIGTTITANLAAMIANNSAKRAARAHLIFNVFGVLWVLAIFPFFIHFISLITERVGEGNPIVATAAVPVALSIFHTTFNILNVVIMIWFAPFIAKVVTKLVPNKEEEDNSFKLQHINIGLLSTPDASIFQAKQELMHYAQNVSDMFTLATAMIDMNKKDFDKSLEKLNKLEDLSDDVEVEIANYFTKVSETKLSTTNSKRVRAGFKMVSDLESLADSAYNVGKILNRQFEQKAMLSERQKKRLSEMCTLVQYALDEMCRNIKQNHEDINIKKAHSLESDVNEFRATLRQENIGNVVYEKAYDYATGVIYTDAFEECEKVADFAINVSEAIDEIKES
ncbi:MAG: Na/Pi cotransporter family protein [Marinifilaceae bacterium]|jgi:phosphate:Na+ symporter|nr:Na/Pi cotransporter family protein [Marinifilaceae bacterium]